MRKVVVFIVSVITIGISFSGCIHYDQAEKDQVTEKGSKMMVAWVEENMPDAELTECSAYISNIRYSSQMYLTDYATGRIRVDGQEIVFAIDTVSGMVYFESTQDRKESLQEIAANYLYEKMGVTPEGSDDFFECYVLAPYREEGEKPKAYQFCYGFDFGLPSNVTDLEAFVRNPASRPLLYVQTKITLSDHKDLAAYDLATIEALSEECGILFGNIQIENGTQFFQNRIKDWTTIAKFYEYGSWIERDGFELFGYVRVREEKRDDITSEVTVSDQSFVSERDLVFEETETGYQYYLPNEEWQEGFWIQASKDAEIREYDYIEYQYYDSDVEGFLSGQYDFDREDGIETTWIEQSNGSYILSSKTNGNTRYFVGVGKLERIP